MDKLSFVELKKIAKEFNLVGKTKKELLHSVFSYYCDLKKHMKYTFKRQLGVEGKDGRTFLVENSKKELYALKLFRKSKHRNQIQTEIDMQSIASDYGVAPKVVDYSLDGRYIVMEKLDSTLYDCFVKQNGQLTMAQQKSIVLLFKKLDDAGILHGDPNPLNFLKKGRRWYIIDYGFAEKITDTVKRRFTNTPNMKCMTLGLIVQLRKLYKDCTLEHLEFVAKSKII